jgi:hypothetical protein
MKQSQGGSSIGNLVPVFVTQRIPRAMFYSVQFQGQYSWSAPRVWLLRIESCNLGICSSSSFHIYSMRSLWRPCCMVPGQFAWVPSDIGRPFWVTVIVLLLRLRWLLFFFLFDCSLTDIRVCIGMFRWLKWRMLGSMANSLIIGAYGALAFPGQPF